MCDADVVVHVGILRLAGERLLIRMKRGVILARSIQTQPEIAIGFRVSGSMLSAVRASAIAFSASSVRENR